MAWEYDIEGDYGYGWEVVTCEATREEANARVAEYRENEPGIRFRVKVVREENA